MNEFYVYGYVRSQSSDHGPAGSFYYIGKGKGNRKTQTKCRLCPVPKDPNNIVMLSERMSETDAFQLEVLLIHLYGRVDNHTGCLLNRTDGGEGANGAKHSDESKAKLSLANKGKKLSPETKAKIGEHTRRRNIGRVHSPEARAKMAASHLGKKMPPRSDEHRAKLSAANKLYSQRLKEQASMPIAA